ncbi:MAG: HD domain-containing phosphohydrolase [Phycisphaerae bacterium]
MEGNDAPTVLLVDDCPANRRLFERLLVKDGVVTMHAVNGQEAIELATQRVPHVIIMDIMMPVMDGLEATRRLRADPRTARIPIIIVSAKTDQEDLTVGLAAGADEYLFKPIRAREFRLRVRSMIRLREAQLDLERANASLSQQTCILAKLNEFSESALVADSIESNCRHIVETAAQLLDSRRVSVLIPDESEKYLRFGYAVGIPPDIWRNQRVPVDSPIAGRVFQTRQEIVVGHQDAPQVARGPYESCCFASLPLICEPLSAGSGVIGVLNITEKAGGQEYTAEEINILRQFARTAALALNSTLTRQKLDVTRDSIILSLARLSEYRHRETGKHLERVRDLSLLLARQLAADPRTPEIIDEQFINDLGRAAPLHDIGKVAIPDRILLKPGKLTAEELEIIKRHTTIGAQTLRAVMSGGHEVSFLQTAMEIAHYHHERYDGKGYPEGLAGEQIPLSARIVAVADSYDAMRMKREYKAAQDHEYAREEIAAASGSQFDPRVVQAFLALEQQFRETYDRHTEEETEEEALQASAV